MQLVSIKRFCGVKEGSKYGDPFEVEVCDENGKVRTVCCDRTALSVLEFKRKLTDNFHVPIGVVEEFELLCKEQFEFEHRFASGA